ncbi:RHS repeat-associated core domain-containing protein, partial [Winogradskyella sp.]|uniref:RHS repeat-associated core domain-containing protein n=1 Tax=Winogradskyella sp. TaxID=1883156 RepID=UPI002611F0F5
DYSFTYTIGSMPRLDLKIDKRFSAVDDGVSTYFYIDNVLATTGTLGIIEENNYYPFGLKHRGYNDVVSANVNSQASKYKYNGKELNDELGLDWYDFGARNYDASLGRWMNLDPLAEKYTNLSPFSYVANNVINAIDPDGRLIIFIGGLRLWEAQTDQLAFGKSGFYTKDEGVFNYWRDYGEDRNSFGQKADIVSIFTNIHKDNNHLFTSGSSSWTSQASKRKVEGKRKAKKFYRKFKKGKIKLADDEVIRIVSHSQGGAHAAGFAEQLMTYKDKDGQSLFNVEIIWYLNPHQPGDIEHPNGVDGFQYSLYRDAISSVAPFWLPNGGSELERIRNVFDNYFGDIFSDEDAEGPVGNRGGHNVTDNQDRLRQVTNEFCRNNPDKCVEVEITQNN